MTQRPAVAVTRCDSYEHAAVTAAVAELLAPFGGMGAFVKPGQRVLVKVNLLMRASPERAVTTHPELVRAVVRAVVAAGAGEVMVGDSPGGKLTSSGMEALLEATGIGPVCREEGVRFTPLDSDITRVPAEGGKLYSSFELGGDAAAADVLISLPKLKTHGFMRFTGAVKNLFGCIPDLAKAQFHLKVPDRDDFADMLVDLLLACRPALSIMDGVVAMEGDGPSGGRPRHLGILLASPDAPALDVVASAIAGFENGDVYTTKAAARRGLAPDDPDGVEVLGVPWRDVAAPDFAHPTPDVTVRMPPGLARWARSRLSAFPRLERPADCTGCATCADACPVAAIRMVEDRPSFDLSQCIRCYCCQELCPQRAIGLASPLLAKAIFGARAGHR